MQSFIISLKHQSIQRNTHPLNHSRTDSPNQSFIINQSLTHSSNHSSSFTQPNTYSITHYQSPTHSLIHSLNCSLSCQLFPCNTEILPTYSFQRASLQTLQFERYFWGSRSIRESSLLSKLTCPILNYTQQ